MVTVLEPVWREHYFVHLEGPLQVPRTGELDRTMRALVRGGERRIILDLARVPSIDAGGIGELIRAHRRMAALDGVLRIVNVNRWVREPLQLAGVFSLLCDDQ